jgi:hypothetical protein
MRLRFICVAVLLLFGISCTGNASEVIFSGEENGQFDLFIADCNSLEVRRITKSKSDEIMVAVSSDGRTIAFVSNREGPNFLYFKDLANNFASAKNIGDGIGVYANPAFAPTSGLIAVQYAPDSKAHFKDTSIVLVDPLKKTQKTIIDSKTVAENSVSLTVVDRPVWISENLLIFVIMEMESAESGRVTKSTIYMHDLKKKRNIRVAGGESYFSPDGTKMGFKATMPQIVKNKDNHKLILFTAVRGVFDRKPMKISLTRNDKDSLDVGDDEFFGPLMFNTNSWVYGIMDEEGIPRLVVKENTLTAKRRLIPFTGRILYPAIMPQ